MLGCELNDELTITWHFIWAQQKDQAVWTLLPWMWFHLLTLIFCMCCPLGCEGVEQQCGEGPVPGPGGSVGLCEGLLRTPEAQTEEEGPQHGRRDARHRQPAHRHLHPAHRHVTTVTGQSDGVMTMIVIFSILRVRFGRPKASYSRTWKSDKVLVVKPFWH